MRLIVLITSLYGLSACGQSTPPSTSGGKIEGPPVKGLSHDALSAALAECTKYGRSDDARVRYTPGYCSAVMGAHLSEGYATTSKPAVEPDVNRLH